MKVPWAKKPSDTQRQFVMITLTATGIKEAESFEQTGAEFEILSALTQKRPQSLGSLAKSAQLSFSDCLKACKELKLKGFITTVQRTE